MEAASTMSDWRREVPHRWAPLVYDAAPMHPAAEPHLVPMRDGTRLATDVYRPERLRGRAPAVLIRTCYDKCGLLMDLPGVALALAAEGYVAVVQDVRGRFRSEGERRPFFHEVDDGYDTLEWITQQDWSDGAVGMHGSSYLGFCQWAAAASGHPALRAMSLAMTSQLVPPTWWGPALAAPDGTEWLVSEWASSARIEGVPLDWSHRPYAEVIPEDLTAVRGLLGELRALSADPAALQAHAYPRGLPASALRIPALHVGGWFDLLKAWSLQDWATVSGAPAAADQRLVIGAVDHIGRPFGIEDGDAPRPAGLEPTLAFFAQHLQQRRPRRRPPRVRYEIAGAGWRQADRWPPAPLRPWILHLADAERSTTTLLGGALSARADRRRSCARWIHDPEAPVPSLGTEVVLPIPHEAATHMRPDVATFTSDAPDEALDLVGPAAAQLEIASTAPAMHVIATLLHLAPDGTVHNLAEGIATVDTLHGPARVTVELGAVAFRLHPGHRLRLAISCSRFPTYLPHPGTTESVWTAVRTQAAEQTLWAGGSLGSMLLLSVLSPPR
jgi:uncharacterized protein